MSGRHWTRRQFLGRAALAAGGALAWPRSSYSQNLAATQIRVAVVGCGIRGRGYLLPQSQNAADVKITALCDPDLAHLNAAFADLTDQTGVTLTQDVRTLVNRNDIDAFMIGAPTHWHALMTVWATMAGKDVFCEKPVSHNIREGRLMRLAAEHHGRMLQIGTQRRSASGAQNAKAYLASATTGITGALGPIQWIHCWWYSARPSVGLQNPPWDPSGVANFDWNLYAGPAPADPIPWGVGPTLNTDDIHSDWHFSWLYGNGDLANLGIHVFDQARFVAGIANAPTRVMSIGNRYVHNDGGQAPNAQLTLMEYPGFPVVVENRGLSSSSFSPGGSVPARSNGFMIQCQNGYAFGFDSAAIYNNSHAQQQSWSAGSPDSSHAANFFNAVRSRDASSLIAPVHDVNPTNDGCLVGNASYRMGTPTATNTIRAAIAGMGAAPGRLESLITHLAGHGVNVDSNNLIMGPWLTYDEPSGEVTHVNGATGAAVDNANALLTDSYRAPFTMPANVPVELSRFAIE